ncbi:IclR family transcriptional regulator C-terminal domain-containing protein [Pelomonas sp. KK5]|uniref:IclR family transcriptional regulator domain-containing protein n=1 Tax=Pelomonas sp. KK5 TaxID=1855730 RepID=UPI0009FA10DF|nr:IclR family transcriptional regulator C-terminal domain-containing protein [Pelomonas sp. KK5]
MDDTEATPDPYFMTSLARGLQVLRAFSEFRRQLTMAQVSQATGLSRAAVMRCLHTLKKLGYVQEEPEGRRFSLRPQVLALAHGYLASTPLAAIAQPHLDRVSGTLRESCSIATLDGEDIVYICRSAETRIMSINLIVGTRLPAYCTSMGRVLLAQLPAVELDRYLDGLRLVARTDRTVGSVTRLRKLILQAREDDYAMIDQELEAGVCSIAVPIRDGRGKAVAAINIGAHAARVSREDMLERFLPVLRGCAAELGRLLV